MEKVVLAYSGGLDTSVAIEWLRERYDLEVVTLTVDVGSNRDFTSLQQRALQIGAAKALVVDAKRIFVEYFLLPALQAEAIYQGYYPLATALSRPLMAKLLVDTAQEEGAFTVAHGCTGKGNDQVRFEVGITTLAPQLKIIAPAREWGMTRAQTILYAGEHGIPIPLAADSPYSIDANLWGRSIECGILEDPWEEPPEEIFAWTKSPKDAPEEPYYIEIDFEQGIPLALDGDRLDRITLIQKLNDLAGSHGVGRIDHVEDRLVGIKSREIYEAPAATVLLQAHQALEGLILSKEQLRFKQKVATEYAELIYNGLWLTPFREDLTAYVQSSQRHITGTVRLKLFKGSCTIVGRKSPYSLYRHELATYDKEDVFNQQDSPGFIHIWGLPAKTQVQVQSLGQLKELPVASVASKNKIKPQKGEGGAW
jgi:argininosuccinate synthase